MNTHMFSHLVDISLGWISHSIYISLYKCCIYKIDTRLILAGCDLQQQQRLVVYTQNSSGIKCTLRSDRLQLQAPGQRKNVCSVLKCQKPP